MILDKGSAAQPSISVSPTYGVGSEHPVASPMIMPSTTRTVIVNTIGVGVRTIIVGMDKEGDLKAFVAAYLRSHSGVFLPPALSQTETENVLCEVYSAQYKERRFSSMSTTEVEFSDVVSAIKRFKSSLTTEEAHYHAYLLMYFMKHVGLAIISRLPVIPLVESTLIPSYGTFMNDVKASLICNAVSVALQAKLAIYKDELKKVGSRYLSSSAFHRLSMPARLYSTALQEAYKLIASELAAISCSRNALGCMLQYVQDPTVKFSMVPELDLQYLANNLTIFTYAMKAPGVVPTSTHAAQADASRFVSLIRKYFSLREGGVGSEGWKEGDRMFGLRPLGDVLAWTSVKHYVPVDSQAAPVTLIELDMPDPKKHYGAFVPIQADNLAYRVVEDTTLEGKMTAVYKSCEALIPMDRLEELYMDKLTEGDASSASALSVSPMLSGGEDEAAAVWLLANAISSHMETITSLRDPHAKSHLRLYGRLAYAVPTSSRWVLPQKGDLVYVDVPSDILSSDASVKELKKFLFACARPQIGSGLPMCGELPMLAFTGGSKTERYAVWLDFNRVLRPYPPRVASYERKIGKVDVDFTSLITDDDGAAGLGDQQIVASVATLMRDRRMERNLARILPFVTDAQELEPIARQFVETAQRTHGRAVLSAAVAAKVDRAWFLTQQGKAELLTAAVGKALAEALQYHGTAAATLFSHLVEYKAIERAIIKMTRTSEA